MKRTPPIILTKVISRAYSTSFNNLLRETLDKTIARHCPLDLQFIPKLANSAAGTTQLAALKVFQTQFKNSENNEHVILIDDLRILSTQFPWNEKSYGNINFLDTIRQIILSINPNYTFSTLNGHVQDDVLCAFVPDP